MNRLERILISRRTILALIVATAAHAVWWLA